MFFQQATTWSRTFESFLSRISSFLTESETELIDFNSMSADSILNFATTQFKFAI